MSQIGATNDEPRCPEILAYAEHALPHRGLGSEARGVRNVARAVASRNSGHSKYLSDSGGEDHTGYSLPERVDYGRKQWAGYPHQQGESSRPCGVREYKPIMIYTHRRKQQLLHHFRPF